MLYETKWHEEWFISLYRLGIFVISENCQENGRPNITRALTSGNVTLLPTYILNNRMTLHSTTGYTHAESLIHQHDRA